MTAPIRPIDPALRSTLGTMVTDQLRDHVIHGRFAPGTVLGEVALAAQFGVSRGPVREALQRLLQEGLLRREPRRGISVPVLAEADVRDIYLARAAIESAAAGVVVRADTTALAAELSDLAARMGRAHDAGDWGRLVELDLAFHRRIVEAAASPRLSRLYAALIGETFAFLNLSVHYPRGAELLGQHVVLAAAIAARDLAAVRATIARHLDPGRDEPAAEPATPEPATDAGVAPSPRARRSDRRPARRTARSETRTVRGRP